MLLTLAVALLPSGESFTALIVTSGLSICDLVFERAASQPCARRGP
jgi:hypothetical protein